MSIASRVGKIYHKFYLFMRCCLIKRNHINEFKLKTNASVLSASDKTQIKKYYGKWHRCSTVFHNFYTEKTGAFHVNYLPDDLYYGYIDPYFNPIQKAKVMDNKCFYQRLFLDIKQPETKACRINGLWFSERGDILSENEAFELICKEAAVFVKQATESFGGHGVEYISSENGDMTGRLAAFTKRNKSDIIVQKPLRQHSSIATINESSVNTIRILSLLSPGGVKIYSSVLRIGANGSKVDNASSGGITCGIHDDGTLNTYAYYKNGDRCDVHPDSGVRFCECVIPSFEEARNLVKRAHYMIPHFRLVSWDIAIDETGEPVLIEANFSTGELDFHQLNNGPVFGDDTDKILSEVFKGDR